MVLISVCINLFITTIHVCACMCLIQSMVTSILSLLADGGNSVIGFCLLAHHLPDSPTKSDADKIVLFTHVRKYLLHWSDPGLCTDLIFYPIGCI